MGDLDGVMGNFVGGLDFNNAVRRDALLLVPLPEMAEDADVVSILKLGT